MKKLLTAFFIMVAWGMMTPVAFADHHHHNRGYHHDYRSYHRYGYYQPYYSPRYYYGPDYYEPYYYGPYGYYPPRHPHFSLHFHF